MSLLLLVPAIRAQGPTHLTQVVQQAEPPVTWPPPASIGYGTALDAAELDASSTVPGSFTYAPAAGAVLAAGQQTLTAVFTPADSNYKTATVQVPLVVRSAVDATFEFGAWKPAPGQIIWTPGEGMTLWLTPTGDFHQPITLSCAVTEGFRCVLDQTLMRPVNVALPLRVMITRTVEEGPSPVRPPVGMAPALVLLILFVRRRKSLQGLLLMVLVVGIVGCGSARTGVATITAQSLTETKTLVIHLVDKR